MRVVTIDTETTGIDDGYRVVELAAVDGNEWDSTLVAPGAPISFDAMAVHHITEEMVHGRPGLAEILSNVEGDVARLLPSLLVGADALAGHNIAYDLQGLRNSGAPAWLLEKPTICTWRCSMHVWPDAPSHKNQALRYWLKLDVAAGADPVTGGLLPAHRALADALVTQALLRALMATGRTAEDLVATTREPILLRTCRFGKHRGTPWSEVPRDYLRWMQREGFDDPDVVHTVRHWLAQPIRARTTDAASLVAVLRVAPRRTTSYLAWRVTADEREWPNLFAGRRNLRGSACFRHVGVIGGWTPFYEIGSWIVWGADSEGRGAVRENLSDEVFRVKYEEHPE